MHISNQALKKTVTAMKKALARDHGINVPYTALRASYLSAQGINAHAIRKAEDKTPKTEWLTRTLYLVEDSSGCLERLAFDPSGKYQLPEDFSFPTGRASMVKLFAEVPNIRRYGLPQYLEDASSFFMHHFELETHGTFKSSYKDLGDDSGDTANLEISITKKEWERILLNALQGDSSLSEDVAVWVGLHFGVNFDTCLETIKLDLTDRFLYSHFEAEEVKYLPKPAKEPKAANKAGIPALPLQPIEDELRVEMEWVWSDQDGGSVICEVNLETGIVTPRGELPADLELADDIRLAVTSDYEEERFPLVHDQMAEPACWRLKPRRLAELKKFLRESDLYPTVN